MFEQPMGQKVAGSVPVVYFGTWLIDFPWPSIAAMLAAVWTLGLIWKAWIWTPYLQPWLASRKA